MTENQIYFATHKVLDDVKRIFNLSLSTPEIRFHRGGKTCGLAAVNGKFVSFNLDIAEQYPNDFNSTIIHEVAHLVTFILHPNAKQAHGPEWKNICKSLGGTGTTRAQYAVNRSDDLLKTGKYFQYKCLCKNNIAISRTIHNRIENGKSSYSCKLCKSKIVKV